MKRCVKEKRRDENKKEEKKRSGCKGNTRRKGKVLKEQGKRGKQKMRKKNIKGTVKRIG